jgi:hypothetical protein
MPRRVTKRPPDLRAEATPAVGLHGKWWNLGTGSLAGRRLADSRAAQALKIVDYEGRYGSRHPYQLWWNSRQGVPAVLRSRRNGGFCLPALSRSQAHLDLLRPLGASRRADSYSVGRLFESA